jgi:hypothetical protein
MPRLVTQDPATLRRYDLEDTLSRLAVQGRELDVLLARYERLRRGDPYSFTFVRGQHGRRTADRANVTEQIAKVRAALAALDAAPGGTDA